MQVSYFMCETWVVKGINCIQMNMCKYNMCNKNEKLYGIYNFKKL